MKNIDKNLLREIITHKDFSGSVSFMEPMKDHTSLRIGGQADVFAVPKEAISLKNMLFALKEEGIPFIPVGGGTNMLVRDNGIEGVVISLKNFERMDIVGKERDSVMIYIESGAPLQKLVSLSRDNGYSGIEGLIGIPGSIGGAVSGNAGSFGYSVKDVLISATLMDADGEVTEINADRLRLGYRSSRIPQGSIILSAIIEMRPNSKEDVKKKMKEFIKEKRERHPLSELSAGCVFRNPEGMSAGRLIDEAGCKGMKIGEVEVSGLHANYFVNKGNATASDFIRLMDEVSKRVRKAFGINLEPEIRIIGRR
ncbi:MAG: UDP-N-acetylmuramate dehydrogenase [Nitrospirae bacterium]|nr:UDP-N-acetylmuramate dehydrogenase [Nitrospirota bacterium]